MSDAYGALPEKPRPQPAPENTPYWDGLRAHRLLVQRCAACGKLRHYPRPMCEVCYAMTYTFEEIERSGSVHSWTVSHHPFHPAFKRDVPYVTVTADLDAGVRLQAPLLGADAGALEIGAPLMVEFSDVDGDLTLPCVRLGKPRT
jgi:uncharacterized OB-fold protein